MKVISQQNDKSLTISYDTCLMKNVKILCVAASTAA